MSEPSWFHVFNSDKALWLHEGGDWGRYSGAEEFDSYEEAREAAEDQLKGGLADTVIVLADHGNVDYDPSPYCYGGHKGPADCDCGPIAE